MVVLCLPTGSIFSFRPNTPCQNIFKFITEIIVRLLGLILLQPLPFQQTDILHGQHILHQCHIHQIGNGGRTVRLLHRPRNRFLLYIIAHHRRSNRGTPQFFQVCIDITSHLFQVKPHRWNFPIAGQMDVPHDIHQLFISFHGSYYTDFSEKVNRVSEAYHPFSKNLLTFSQNVFIIFLSVF